MTTTHLLPRIASFTLIVGLVAAGCGDTGSGTAAPAPPATAAPTTAPPPTTAPAPTPTTTTTTTTTPPPPPPPPTTSLPGTPPTNYEEFAAQDTACGGTAPPPPIEGEFTEPGDENLDPAATVTATIVTSCGPITVSLDAALAPETVNSFVFLARQGFFDGTVSHRVVPGFVIQAGDPSATGRGGPGYVIADEFPEAPFLYTRGMLAMANAGPGTTGSQFFIVLADVGLAPQFSVFGEVTAGFDVLDRIAGVPLGFNAFGEQSVPLETLYLESVAVTID